MAKLHLITGASGLLGSHIAKQLCEAGERVRAFVRPTSDTRHLRDLDVEICTGQLDDIASIRRAVEGTDIVYHCAACVSDWGSWNEFHTGTVVTTKNLVQACLKAGTPRILHVSSISVYGKRVPKDGLVPESTPIGQSHWLWDHYGRTKVLAEEQFQKYPDVVIVRPSWVYGPCDRNSIPRVIKALRSGRVRVIGPGDNTLNMVFAADVARGAVLAAQSNKTQGKSYHLCSPGEATQRDLLDLLCDQLKLPPVKRTIPLHWAWRAAFLVELLFRIARRRQPPPITRRAIYMIGRTTRFSIEAAERDFGWKPLMPLQNGLKTTVDWYLQQEQQIPNNPQPSDS